MARSDRRRRAGSEARSSGPAAVEGGQAPDLVGDFAGDFPGGRGPHGDRLESAGHARQMGDRSRLSVVRPSGRYLRSLGGCPGARTGCGCRRAGRGCCRPVHLPAHPAGGWESPPANSRRRVDALGTRARRRGRIPGPLGAEIRWVASFLFVAETPVASSGEFGPCVSPPSVAPTPHVSARAWFSGRTLAKVRAPGRGADVVGGLLRAAAEAGRASGDEASPPRMGRTRTRLRARPAARHGVVHRTK